LNVVQFSSTTGGLQIDDAAIWTHLEAAARADASLARDAIAKARCLGGLDADDVAVLLQCEHPAVIRELYEAAREVKEEIYGKRLVLFAPLYISNLCSNDCQYCAFRTSNQDVRRRVLSQQEIASEVRRIIASGHKRILLVAGERRGSNSLGYILRSIETAYETREGKGAIRRINVNIAPLTVEEFRKLKKSNIGTYQLFQETYHRCTYRAVHTHGPKRDYDWRLGAIGRAMEAGIDDVGIGVLFGLFDFRYEVLAMLEHIRGLEREHGVGPHTISVPRIEPAEGSALSAHPPRAVSDRDFKRIVAILRLAVPYTGIIMSTRETPQMRRETFALGVSQISAGSRTNPGGYGEEGSCAQFQLGDHRHPDEVIRDCVELGYIPSFCTACYRLGRTGGDFMELAKPGLIKLFCLPNAILTFKEYLEDYASAETLEAGRTAITEKIAEIPSDERRTEVRRRLQRIEAGERDLYF